ncbi:Cys-tRNA(Pro) deacylase [Frigoriglobus tundricola]|uniref:Cys-tRNA(Pro)/Cys-tRNA(Cys) deacylase n=1 Tax=Frigoriglobus tundricola TaxID=2774151 RepID=A0A6M5Z1A2_9BACT|nr:Cys-tRNA(Pro) deacylase [Frigoriglobus tundricola]QJX00178.1 Cys-tRNA(Pro) deacylase YbaK [Frigoriglobus tundricola]
MSRKTNAARLLDEAGISYELRSYPVDLDDLSALSVAAKVGLPPEQLFKTLVVRGDRYGICFAVVPGDSRLDLKALARVTGDRKIEPVTLKEVQPLTGYVRGGVTVLGAKKAYPVYVDTTIELFETVSISAGERGLQILLAPADYLRICNATRAEIGTSEPRS